MKRRISDEKEETEKKLIKSPEKRNTRSLASLKSKAKNNDLKIEILPNDNSQNISPNNGGLTPAIRNIDVVHLGPNFQISAWFPSPFPEDVFAPVSPTSSEKSQNNRIIYACEYCLRYTSKRREFIHHLTNGCAFGNSQPEAFQIPGEIVYSTVSTLDSEMKEFNHDRNNEKNSIIRHEIYLVDAKQSASSKRFAQCLCLLGKLFIDQKTLFYDLGFFLFYVLVEVVWTKEGRKRSPPYRRIVGYFSKEKVSFDNFNLACIIIFPPHQGKGYGRLLMEFSYHLSRKENKIGSPERPLSKLGRASYHSFWINTVLIYLYSLFPDNQEPKKKPTRSIIISKLSKDSSDINQNNSISSAKSVMARSVRSQQVNKNVDGSTEGSPVSQDSNLSSSIITRNSKRESHPPDLDFEHSSPSKNEHENSSNSRITRGSSRLTSMQTVGIINHTSPSQFIISKKEILSPYAGNSKLIRCRINSQCFDQPMETDLKKDQLNKISSESLILPNTSSYPIAQYFNNSIHPTQPVIHPIPWMRLQDNEQRRSRRHYKYIRIKQISEETFIKEEDIIEALTYASGGKFCTYWRDRDIVCISKSMIESNLKRGFIVDPACIINTV